MEIRVSYEGLRNIASQFRNESEKIETLVDRIKFLGMATMSDWDGDASYAYFLSNEKLADEMLRLEEYIRELAVSLDYVANAYEDMDRLLAEQWKSKDMVASVEWVPGINPLPSPMPKPPFTFEIND